MCALCVNVCETPREMQQLQWQHWNKKEAMLFWVCRPKADGWIGAVCAVGGGVMDASYTDGCSFVTSAQPHLWPF